MAMKILLLLSEQNLLTTIHANQEPSENEKLIWRDMLGEGHRQRRDDPDQVVDQEPALASKLVGDPAPDEPPAHPPDGEDRNGHGVHEGWRLISHIFPVVSLTMGFADKLLNDLKC